jgi:methanogenic corrinoid protein MtbC1
MMSELLNKIAYCIEFGKINRQSPYPPDLKDQDGADEYTQQALQSGISAQDVLLHGLITGMEKIGKKFRENQVFVPQVLMSAKAMNTAMAHLMPYFSSGELKSKGTFIIGTVAGDLHDIGKNLVSMIMKGNGWKVIDLGMDVSTEKFMEAIQQHPDAVVGLSALLTTTMASMEQTVARIKTEKPATTVAIGGAPVSQAFCEKIGADVYSPHPQGLVEYLEKNQNK